MRRSLPRRGERRSRDRKYGRLERQIRPTRRIQNLMVQKIGEGAFSCVYLANQVELADRFVVLKIVSEPLAEPEYMALLQHTNIVPIYSFHCILSRSVICMGIWMRRGARSDLPERSIMMTTGVVGRLSSFRPVTSWIGVTTNRRFWISSRSCEARHRKLVERSMHFWETMNS